MITAFATNPLLTDEDQERQRVIRKSIDILVSARAELMEDPDYDMIAGTTLWIIINRFVNEGRALAEAGWSRPYPGWYSRYQALCRANART